MEPTANPIIAAGGRRGPASSDVTTQLNALVNLDSAQLRAEWRRLYRSHPPKGLSRDLMIRAMAYKLQERTFGGLGSLLGALLLGGIADLWGFGWSLGIDALLLVASALGVMLLVRETAQRRSQKAAPSS